MFGSNTVFVFPVHIISFSSRTEILDNCQTEVKWILFSQKSHSFSVQWLCLSLQRVGLCSRETYQIRPKHIKGWKERYLLGQKHNLLIFGVVLFIKLQNDTLTTVKRWKPMKNEIKANVSCNILPSTRQENNTAQPKTNKWFSFSSHFSLFHCCLSVVL